jgi:ABC-2 type transport system permease protein
MKSDQTSANLTTMQWLLRREVWEHKGMVLWAPAVVACIVAALVLGGLLMGHNVTINLNGQAAHLQDYLAEHMMQPGAKQQFARAASELYVAIGAPLYLELGILVFFYCLGALYDDRRDRSLLFWKSLPVSDRMTVLSKVAVALAVTPVITMLAATALSLTILLLLCTVAEFQGVHLFGALLGTSEFYLAPLRMFGLLPVYMLWALPTVGWLLLVSSWARSKVFLWAVGVPLGAGMLVTWTSKIFALHWDIGWFMQHVVARLLTGVAPGSWFMYVRPASLHDEGEGRFGAAELLADSWTSLSSPVVWVGAAAGIAMIAGAVWMRRWRDEA